MVILFVLLLILIPTNLISATPKIPSVPYVHNFFASKCDTNLPYPEFEIQTVASKKYILNLVDYLNENTTNYSVEVQNNVLSSADALQSYLKLLKRTTRCSYIRGASCPEYEEIAVQNFVSPDENNNCPSDMELYTIPQSLCVINSTNSKYTAISTGTTTNNRGKWAIGDTCADGVCQNTYVTGEAHCSTSEQITSETTSTQFEPYGVHHCWCRVTMVASPSGEMETYNGKWIKYGDSGYGTTCDYACPLDCAYIFQRYPFYRRSEQIYKSSAIGVCGPRVTGQEISYNIQTSKTGNWAVGKNCDGQTIETNQQNMCEAVIAGGTSACLNARWGTSDINENTTGAGSVCWCRRQKITLNNTLIDSVGPNIFVSEFTTQTECYNKCAKTCADNVAGNITINDGGLRNAIMVLSK